MQGMTVVVTGASRGLGAAVAQAFAAEDAHVVACARDEAALEETVDAIEDAGGSAEHLRADVRDEFDMERLMEVAARAGGDIDVVVPAAAVLHGDFGGRPLHEESYTAFDDTMRTNLRGVFAAVKEAVPHFAPDARVLVPSEAVTREAAPGAGAYAVSKVGAEALTRGFAADLDATVGVVDSGAVTTEPTGGEERSLEEAASMFVWAATEADAEEVDGGVVDSETWGREA